jgi:hypothetical protein
MYTRVRARTHTHKYVIFITFATATMIRERASMLKRALPIILLFACYARRYLITDFSQVVALMFE